MDNTEQKPECPSSTTGEHLFNGVWIEGAERCFYCGEGKMDNTEQKPLELQDLAEQLCHEHLTGQFDLTTFKDVEVSRLQRAFIQGAICALNHASQQTEQLNKYTVALHEKLKEAESEKEALQKEVEQTKYVALVRYDEIEALKEEIDKLQAARNSLKGEVARLQKLNTELSDRV